MALLALVALWVTSSSPLLLYGSLGLAILLTVLRGLARIDRIERIRQQRARQASACEAANPR